MVIHEEGYPAGHDGELYVYPPQAVSMGCERYSDIVEVVEDLHARRRFIQCLSR